MTVQTNSYLRVLLHQQNNTVANKINTTMEKLTFKQYLDSKEQLLKAIENTPVSTVEYEVKKYCSLTLGESEDSKIIVSLKPKQKVIVEWHYNNVDNPTPEYVRLVGLKETDEDEKHDVYWTGSKLTKWLSRHTRREN